MDFQEADRRYAEITQRQEAGDLTRVEFDEELKQLMVQDEEGRWWAKSRKTGEWHYHDGVAWVKDTPPGYQTPQATPKDQSEIRESPPNDKSTPDPPWVRAMLGIIVGTLLLLFIVSVIAFGR